MLNSPAEELHHLFASPCHSYRNPRSSSPVSVREIVCGAPSSECRVALAERNHSVCLVSENASTLRQFLCGREFIARE